MKRKSTMPKPNAFMALAICGSLLMAQPAMAIGKIAKRPIPARFEEEEPVKKKSKAKERAFASLNNQSVRIFPHALKREMHIVAKDNNGKTVDFFVFDVEGTLVQNCKLQSKDHYKISGLKRGTYVYRVFCGDEETAAGKFEIR